MIRYNPNINEGLNTSQIQYRIKYNHVNKNNSIDSNSICKIIFKNTMTLFNLINLIFSFLFLIERSYIGFLFIVVILFNTIIHVIKNIKTKKFIDKINSNKKVLTTVIRDSKTISINSEDIVLDDIVVYKENNEVVTDSIILDGLILIDESSLNGKMPVIKTVNDMIYKGSKILGGKCICRAEKVGANNYLSKITTVIKNKKNNSSIKYIINSIIKCTSILLFIMGIIIYFHTNSLITIGITLYKVLPIELVLLTTISFLLFVKKLKKNNVLVKTLTSIENSKNIDTICFDKTGTLTKTSMTIERLVVLNNKVDCKEILSSIGKYCNKSNNIIESIHNKYNKKTNYEFISEENFNSYIKINFKGHKYLLGDPKYLDSSIDISKYNEYEVVLLKTEKENLALLLLTYDIKDKTKELINNLYKSDINIKIMSGDSKESVINMCKKAGIKKIKSIDMSVNHTNMNHQIVEEYNVFYNASPEQKKILVNALKNNKHKVIMVGDGINDILSLDASNSSVSISNGIIETAKVSDYVILDNKIDSIWDILNNSTTTINSMYKIISIYLYKLIYTFLLVITLFICNIYSYNFDLIYTLIFLIPTVFIIFKKDYSNIKFNSMLNKSILFSLITYLLTLLLIIVKYILNIDITILNSLILVIVFVMLILNLFKNID